MSPGSKKAKYEIIVVHCFFGFTKGKIIKIVIVLFLDNLNQIFDKISKYILSHNMNYVCGLFGGTLKEVDFPKYIFPAL